MAITLQLESRSPEQNERAPTPEEVPVEKWTPPGWTRAVMDEPYMHETLIEYYKLMQSGGPDERSESVEDKP